MYDVLENRVILGLDDEFLLQIKCFCHDSLAIDHSKCILLIWFLAIDNSKCILLIRFCHSILPMRSYAVVNIIIVT